MTVVTVTEIKHQARLAQWRDKIVDCRSNGNNVKRWCAENNVSDATYYRWEREIFGHAQERRNMEALPANTTFAELPAPKKSVSGTPVWKSAQASKTTYILTGRDLQSHGTL